MKKEQLERIARMEAVTDQARQAVDALQAALDAYTAVPADLKELETYYAGPAWKEDFRAAEEGKLPAGMKHGVLAEDTVYDLLADRDELHRQLRMINEEEDG